MRIAAFALAAAASALPSLAHAQDATDTWSFEFSAGTDSRSRGVSKTNGEPYVFGEVEWAPGDAGLYAAASIETVDHSTGSDLETKLTAGWRTEAAGFDLDLFTTFRAYPGADAGADDRSWEFTADVSRDLTDRVDARLRLQYSPDGAGSTRSYTWLEARGRVELTDRLRASAALGRREQVNSRDYTAWNIGLDYRVNDHLGLDLRWYDTDVENPGDQYDSALVGVVTIGF